MLINAEWITFQIHFDQVNAPWPLVAYNWCFFISVVDEEMIMEDGTILDTLNLLDGMNYEPNAFKLNINKSIWMHAI